MFGRRYWWVSITVALSTTGCGVLFDVARSHAPSARSLANAATAINTVADTTVQVAQAVQAVQAVSAAQMPASDEPSPDPSPDASPDPSPDGGEAAVDNAADVAPEITTSDPEELVASSEPPDPIYEEPTDPTADDDVWIPGYWHWAGADWTWVDGTWRLPPLGMSYVEPYYERVGARVVYVGGYWGSPAIARRSYGGDRIHFVPAVRPNDYHPAPHVVIHHAGLRPGQRVGGGYVHASGAVHELPAASKSRRPSFTAHPVVARHAPAPAAHVEPSRPVTSRTSRVSPKLPSPFKRK
jgi:hypothetical protein